MSVTQSVRTRGPGKKPKKPRKTVVHVGPKAVPGGGNPPLGSNVIRGSDALECCEENSDKDNFETAVRQALDAFNELRDKLREPFDYQNSAEDKAINFLFGDPKFIKQLQSGLSPVGLDTVTEIPLNSFKVSTSFTRAPGRAGLLALVVPTIGYIKSYYDSVSQTAAEEAIALAANVLDGVLKARKTKKKTNSCYECIKAKLLRQEPHKSHGL